MAQKNDDFSRAFRDLQRYLGFQPDQMFGDVTISAEMAKVLLIRNKKNRHLSDRVVARYARDMKEGNWVRTSDSISFNFEGFLTDGQHRLTSLALTKDVSITFHVILGVDYSLHQDTGKARNLYDNMVLQDSISDAIKNRLYIAIFKAAWTASSKTTKSIRSVSNEDVIKSMEKYANAFEDLNKHRVFAKTKTARNVSSASVFAAYFLAYVADVPVEVLEHFAEVMRNGVMMSEYDKPIIGARNKVSMIEGNVSGALRLVMEYVQYGIEAYMRRSKSITCKSTHLFYDVDLWK